MAVLKIQLGQFFLELSVLTFQSFLANRGRSIKTSLTGLLSPAINYAARDLILAASRIDRHQTRFYLANNLLLESSFKLAPLLSHPPSTPSDGSILPAG